MSLFEGTFYDSFVAIIALCYMDFYIFGVWICHEHINVLKFLIGFRERGEGEKRERGRQTDINLLLHLLMLVPVCALTNPQTWHIGTTLTNWATCPGQHTNCLKSYWPYNRYWYIFLTNVVWGDSACRAPPATMDEKKSTNTGSAWGGKAGQSLRGERP